MAVADVSPRDQYAVGTHLKCLEDEVWIDTAGTHHPDNPHIGRILKTADACKISGRIGTPVAGKCDDLGFEFFNHKVKLLF